MERLIRPLVCCCTIWYLNAIDVHKSYALHVLSPQTNALEADIADQKRNVAVSHIAYMLIFTRNLYSFRYAYRHRFHLMKYALSYRILPIEDFLLPNRVFAMRHKV